jgi:hypothetical protein
MTDDLLSPEERDWVQKVKCGHFGPSPVLRQLRRIIDRLAPDPRKLREVRDPEPGFNWIFRCRDGRLEASAPASNPPGARQDLFPWTDLECCKVSYTRPRFALWKDLETNPYETEEPSR